MSSLASYPVSSSDAVEVSRLELTTRILRLADGDKAFADQIREMMWGEYRSAGAPLGHSEEGMVVWWNKELSE